MSLSDALDEVGLERYCCRRLFVSHVDLIAEVAPFTTAQQ
jgi:DNA-directed RNA polymerase subunit N (RpoN/RPB10)